MNDPDWQRQLREIREERERRATEPPSAWLGALGAAESLTSDGIEALVIERLYSKVQDSDLPRIAPSVRGFYATYRIEADVANGGFGQAAYNMIELFPIAAEGYELLGRSDLADILRRAEAVERAEGDSVEGCLDRFDAEVESFWSRQARWTTAERVELARRHAAEFDGV